MPHKLIAGTTGSDECADHVARTHHPRPQKRLNLPNGMQALSLRATAIPIAQTWPRTPSTATTTYWTGMSQIQNGSV